MINLLPWREQKQGHKKRQSLWLLVTPILLIFCLQGLSFSLSYLELIAEQSFVQELQRQLMVVKTKAEQEEKSFQTRTRLKEAVIRLREQQQSLNVQNPLDAFPAKLPRGVYVSRVNCVASHCLIQGKSRSFQHLKVLIEWLQSSADITDVNLELVKSDQSKFELNLLLGSDSHDAVAIY